MRYTTLTLLLAVFALTACSDQPTEVLTPDDIAAGIGNQLPSGSHYNLNIIGVPKGKTATLDDNKGHRIFVDLYGGEDASSGWKNKEWNDLSKTNKILLTEGEDFQVLDANATAADPDEDGAEFQLPDPCEGDDSTDGCAPRYQVYARALGTPGGSATITTCADEDGDGFDDADDVWCGSNSITLERRGKKPVTQNVTENLLKMTVTVDDATDPELAACIDPGVDGTDGLPDTYDVYLFDRCFENYFWNYNNNGLKLLQLRFYPG